MPDIVRRGSTPLRLAVLAAALLSFALLPVAALAVAPHVPMNQQTDACAICHRAHTSFSDTTFRSLGSSATEEYALLTAGPGSGDTELCFTCHGVDTLGAESDTQKSFLQPSGHSISPTTSPYGPTPKMCSDCHDSHGTERVEGDTPYPALLRSRTASGSEVYSGDAYCAACHADRAEDTWDGLDVWRETAHAREVTPAASGTGIVCSVCHEPHGSALAPSVRPVFDPPSAPVTVSVSANDRFLCFTCHAEGERTYPAGATYQTSAHAASPATVTVLGEWAAREKSRTSMELSRTVGECQACHAPMGRRAADGSATVHMLEAEGRALCDRCHRAGGVASTDLASLAVTSSYAPRLEVVASYDPSVAPASYGRVSVYSQENVSSSPRGLLGPREWLPPGRTRDVAVGDIDADGRTELVVTDPGAARLWVFTPDPLAGLQRREYSITEPAALLDVADFVLDGSGRPEIAVVGVDGAATSARLYRLQSGQLADLIPEGVVLGPDASDIAAGDVTGTAAADLVVASPSDDSLRILTSGSATLSVTGTVTTGGEPRGVAVADVWQAQPGDEIVVANAGSASEALAVYDGSAALLGAYSVAGDADGQAWAVGVGDVLSGYSGTETAVAVRSAAGTSTVDVFRWNGTGLSRAGTVETGLRYTTGSLASGDVDGDGIEEFVAGNGGWWSGDASGVGPSLSVIGAADPTHPAAPMTLTGGGVELAGPAPAVAVADLGGSLLTRHPVGASPGHVSTEAIIADRHVECVDCHNVHEATSTPAAASSAPVVYGALRGARAVEVANLGSGETYDLTGPFAATTEYGVCLKCHAVRWGLSQYRDIASEVNTRNASVHGVEGAFASSATAGSFTGSWTPSSVLYCVDCHGNSRSSEPTGPHVSGEAPLLRGGYLGTAPGDGGLLCYRCHDRAVYFTGARDETDTASNSLFYDASAGPRVRLHSFHASYLGFGCASCHVSHGSPTQPHLLRGDVGFGSSAAGGSCGGGCHGAAPRTYARQP